MIEFDGSDLVQDTLGKLCYHLIADRDDPDLIAFLHILQSLGDANTFLTETFEHYPKEFILSPCITVKIPAPENS